LWLINFYSILGILGITEPFPETLMDAWKIRNKPSDDVKKKQAAA